MTTCGLIANFSHFAGKKLRLLEIQNLETHFPSWRWKGSGHPAGIAMEASKRKITFRRVSLLPHRGSKEDSDQGMKDGGLGLPSENRFAELSG